MRSPPSRVDRLAAWRAGRRRWSRELWPNLDHCPRFPGNGVPDRCRPAPEVCPCPRRDWSGSPHVARPSGQSQLSGFWPPSWLVSLVAAPVVQAGASSLWAAGPGPPLLVEAGRPSPPDPPHRCRPGPLQEPAGEGGSPGLGQGLPRGQVSTPLLCCLLGPWAPLGSLRPSPCPSGDSLRMTGVATRMDVQRTGLSVPAQPRGSGDVGRGAEQRGGTCVAAVGSGRARHSRLLSATGGLEKTGGCRQLQALHPAAPVWEPVQGASVGLSSTDMDCPCPGSPEGAAGPLAEPLSSSPVMNCT